MLDGDEIVINGRKWWATGVGHPDCKALCSWASPTPTPTGPRHSMVLVPMDTPGVKVERMLDAVRLEASRWARRGLRSPTCACREHVISGPGEGFAIAQGRLGPGRIHHCMRLIGLAELALELACRRALERTAFGKPLANLGGNRERIADARIAIDQARLLVLDAAWHGQGGPPGPSASRRRSRSRRRRWPSR